MMAIHLQCGKNSIAKETDNVHSLPCKIHADVDAEVSKYFLPYVKTENGEVLKASFRGYPLKGKKITLPDDYKGLVFHETVKPDREKDERKFFVKYNFKSFVYWNWDKNPSKNDVFQQALDWIDIANALHTPLTEE